MTYLIDVRSSDEFKNGHLENAIHIDHKEILQKIESVTIDKNAKIYLYCKSGMRSAIAVQLLHGKGYYHAVNIGSYDTLKASLKHSFKKTISSAVTL